MLNVEVKPDGTLTDTPVAGRPGSPATLTANALHMLESGTNASKPAAGDVIEVELRLRRAGGAVFTVLSTLHLRDNWMDSLIIKNEIAFNSQRSSPTQGQAAKLAI